MLRTLASLLAVSLSLTAAADPPPPGRDLAPDVIARSVLEDMDPTADPCTDFYRYACGAWLDRTEMPADQSRWGRSFSTIHLENRKVLRRLFEEAGSAPASDPERRKVGDTYAACMDEEAIEAAGVEPLSPWLARIATVRDAGTFLAVAGELTRVGPTPAVSLFVAPDPKQPELTVAHLFQGGLGLPERDYYLSDDAGQRELRAAYEAHVAKMLGLLGRSEARASKEAKAVVKFETALAEASRSAVDLRKPEELYHRLDRAGLAALTPRLDWDRFFGGLGAADLAEINVATPEFMTALDRLARKSRPGTLQAYLAWNLVSGTASTLPRRFVEQSFDFYGRTLSGQRELQPRWKRCVAATEAALPDAVGKLFAAERFAGNSKELALELVVDLEEAFVQSLPGLAWMDEETRARARAKQAAIAEMIGFPDRWQDYSTLAVSRAGHFANAAAANRFEAARQLAKVGGPVDKGEWGMPVQIVNAGYNPLMNRITFPAGILQPPFFHKDYPPAINYGAVGTVMGHEITHGFDDEGRKYDPQGRLHEWWAPEVSARFEERAACIRDQFSGFEIEPGQAVDGALTLGENLADAGGLKQAYQGYQRWQERHGGPGPGLGSLTDDQLFFVAHGQVWCELSTPEMARLLVKTDVHSPGRFRVIGPIANHPAFAPAFGCPAGAPMHPVEKCEVW
jgi:predicted metalloendopeptidase